MPKRHGSSGGDSDGRSYRPQQTTSASRMSNDPRADRTLPNLTASARPSVPALTTQASYPTWTPGTESYISSVEASSYNSDAYPTSFSSNRYSSDPYSSDPYSTYPPSAFAYASRPARPGLEHILDDEQPRDWQGRPYTQDIQHQRYETEQISHQAPSAIGSYPNQRSTNISSDISNFGHWTPQEDSQLLTHTARCKKWGKIQWGHVQMEMGPKWEVEELQRRYHELVETSKQATQGKEERELEASREAARQEKARVRESKKPERDRKNAAKSKRQRERRKIEKEEKARRESEQKRGRGR